MWFAVIIVVASTTHEMCQSMIHGDSTSICLSVKHLPRPLTVIHHKGDHITEGTRARGNYVHRIVKYFEHVLRTDKPSHPTVLDIGANIGLFALSASTYDVRIIAFEPFTKNVRQMYRSMVINKIHNVEVHQVAVGSVPNTMFLFTDASDPVLKSDGIVVNGTDDAIVKRMKTRRGTWAIEPISITTLDVLNSNGRLRDVYFVKIDVEGFESLVFSGGQQFIHNVRPRYIYFEWMPNLWNERYSMTGWMSLRDTIAFLNAHGYDVFYYHHLERMERISSNYTRVPRKGDMIAIQRKIT